MSGLCHVLIAALVLGGLLLAGCGDTGADPSASPVPQGSAGAPSEEDTERATFAGGCFWCMEPPFEKLNGVLEVVSGYTGGTGQDPTYDDYAEKGHVEAVRITYDPDRVDYERLLEVFWRQIDPTDPHGQFVDRGREYRSAIFYHDPEQQRLAEESKRELDESGRFEEPIVTEILPAGEFHAAEDYHQDYHRKRPLRYRFYRSRSGRDRFLDRVWGEDR